MWKYLYFWISDIFLCPIFLLLLWITAKSSTMSLPFVDFASSRIWQICCLMFYELQWKSGSKIALSVFTRIEIFGLLELETLCFSDRHRRQMHHHHILLTSLLPILANSLLSADLTKNHQGPTTAVGEFLKNYYVLKLIRKYTQSQNTVRKKQPL